MTLLSLALALFVAYLEISSRMHWTVEVYTLSRNKSPANTINKLERNASDNSLISSTSLNVYWNVQEYIHKEFSKTQYYHNVVVLNSNCAHSRMVRDCWTLTSKYRVTAGDMGFCIFQYEYKPYHRVIVSSIH